MRVASGECRVSRGADDNLINLDLCFIIVLLDFYLYEYYSFYNKLYIICELFTIYRLYFTF